MDNSEMDLLADKIADRIRPPLVVNQNQISAMLERFLRLSGTLSTGRTSRRHFICLTAKANDGVILMSKHG